MTGLVFHLGYPKTATSTLQSRLFPRHPDIAYGGKELTNYRYYDERLYPLMHELMTATEMSWTGGEQLRSIIREAQRTANKKVLLYSSENFLHPETSDISIVARRLHSLFPDARVIMTFRSQIDLLLSFYRSHGAFAEYLFVTKDRSQEIVLPLSIERWMEYQLRAPHKNLFGTLHYDKVAKAYCDCFGRNLVHMSLFEELKADWKLYIKSLAEFLQIEPDQAISLVDGRSENVGLDASAFEKQSFVLRRRSLKALGVHFHWGERRCRWPSRIPEPWLSRAVRAFAAGNTRLRDQYGLAVDRYGYPTEEATRAR